MVVVTRGAFRTASAPASMDAQEGWLTSPRRVILSLTYQAYQRTLIASSPKLRISWAVDNPRLPNAVWSSVPAACSNDESFKAKPITSLSSKP